MEEQLEQQAAAQAEWMGRIEDQQARMAEHQQEAMRAQTELFHAAAKVRHTMGRHAMYRTAHNVPHGASPQWSSQVASH